MKKIFLPFLFSALLSPSSLLNAQVVCDLAYERTLQTFDVFIHNPSGATMYRAKMYIDADGSPRAYGPNNSGLDWTANAGYTGNWWGVVADATGTNPILQTASDPYPGMYVSTTSLVDANYAISNPLRYVNSETVPFIAVPQNVLASGNIHVGDVAYVYNTTTGQHCFAIYADAGNNTSIGEASIMTASLVGVDPDVRTGGTSLGIIDYVIFPQSGFGQGYIPTIPQIDSIGNIYLASVGGPCIVSCIGPVFDDAPPVTAVVNTAAWDTADFTCVFSDVDTGCGGGIDKSFYQVSDLNSTGDWRANSTHGFFNENFNGSSINSDWTLSTGTWNITSNYLQQTDENLSNTNIYAPLTQNLSDVYLYEWTGTMGGIGTNRRAGFHFFCDAPDSTNRGNSYFVWFRLDDDKIQVYKVINNSWGSGPVNDTAYNFTANVSYDFKVTYDRINGNIRVYVNDVLSAQWTDVSPISNGGYVSFRSANCFYHVDNFKVFRSRAANALVGVGAGNAHDLRFENPNPTTPAGKISSIVSDQQHNLSSVNSQFINVDFSSPSTVVVNDGTANDIDTTNNGTQLQSNWAASSDVNSGISNYYFAIGTTAGAADVIPWTSTTNTSNTSNNLTLVNLQHYYVSVQSVDGAGKRSSVAISDGQMYFDLTTGISVANENTSLSIYPNPSNGIYTIGNSTRENTTIEIFNSTGQVVTSAVQEVNDGLQFDISNEPAGIYFVRITSGNNVTVERVVKE
ncbi:MAG TPA: T9SS type A sorting domain-containing protein [Bacteroidia bacterium]|jgi:hypothetical protein|nr:T9SS type A sorting domain-containing protein [Bacteroidia bacterium]